MPQPASHRFVACVAILAGLGLLTAGCTTMRLEDTLPATTATAPFSEPGAVSTVAASTDPLEAGETASFASVEEQTEAQPPPRSTATGRGGYPNLNIRPVPAAKQLSAAQRIQRTAELRAARQRAQSATGAATTAQTAEQIRRQAREREEETLRRIEGR